MIVIFWPQARHSSSGARIRDNTIHYLYCFRWVYVQCTKTKQASFPEQDTRNCVLGMFCQICKQGAHVDGASVLHDTSGEQCLLYKVAIQHSRNFSWASHCQERWYTDIFLKSTCWGIAFDDNLGGSSTVSTKLERQAKSALCCMLHNRFALVRDGIIPPRKHIVWARIFFRLCACVGGEHNENPSAQDFMTCCIHPFVEHVG